ncbi:hypothetical protein [Plantactinospora endophytica]|uniref:hypothetical protein n=1 Tax=Plantactinospora endophytica TaxID=673535 RepID=UPI0019440318|nr:hypothetical protein [Plantactinospora endophytica]
MAASTVDAAGRMVALLVAPWVTCSERGAASGPYAATVVVVDGDDITEVALPELDLRFPKVDVLGDGFVLVAARCRMPAGPAVRTVTELEAQIPHNGRVVDADGSTRITFHAGDGIEQLVTDPAGAIWISYFDEASVCAPQLATRDPTKPPHRMTMPLPGLIRWTATGDPAWYATQDGYSNPSGWVDCYALNVGAGRVWAYPYPGFPLVEIDQRGIRCVRRTSVRSASGVIVADDRVAFIASQGHGPEAAGSYLVTFARIIDGPVETATTTPLLLPTGQRPTTRARRTVCRDNRMWMQFDDERTWYTLDIQ